MAVRSAVTAAGFGGQGRFPVRPDPVTLAAIARATDGQAYEAKTASKVQNVYKQLGASIATRSTTREVSSWFLGIAALLLFASLGAAAHHRRTTPVARADSPRALEPAEGAGDVRAGRPSTENENVRQWATRARSP